ncbi:MAG: ComEC/Rec2 family competence protein [candidate division SR1 bacterium]|nr:ComEC/Rec2 family competence protein [candidate division SR1 bacterium]
MIIDSTCLYLGKVEIKSHFILKGKYVLTYGNADYLLYSKKEYHIGDQIRIVGRMQKNIQKDGFSYRKISSGTFAIPLFSGSFDFTTWIKMKGRKGTIYEDNSITNYEGKITNGMSIIKQIKKGLQEKIVQVYGKNRISGLILGMLIGDKSQIPESNYQSFINSGLVHLVAVSGGNILMIVVFLQCVLFFIPFYMRLGLILLTIIGYSLICGLDSSVFRAVLMGGMSMIALFRGREINIRRLLSMSALIMLIINPYFLAYDTGFLLSYSAIIGIVYFESKSTPPHPSPLHGEGAVVIPSLRSREGVGGEVKKALQHIYKSYISPRIGASIGIFPVIIFFMGKINLLGIIGNVFVLPLVPFVMIYGFVSVWLYLLLGWEWLRWMEKILVQYIYKISDLLSQYGLYLTVSGLRFKYVILLIFIGFFIYWKTKKDILPISPK